MYNLYHFTDATKGKKKQSSRSRKNKIQKLMIERITSHKEFPILKIVPNEYNYSGEDNTENNNASMSTSFWHAHMYNVMIVTSCVLFSCPILLYPQHNSILYQEYWYEPILSGSASFILTLSLDTLIAIKYYIKDESMVNSIVFIKLYIATVSAWSLTCSLAYLFWTVGLGFNHPMPLTLSLGYIQYATQYITLNFLFYKKESLSENMKQRLRSFTMSRIWALFIDLQYKGLDFVFTFLTPNSSYQWILAFVIPLMREFNFQILYRIMYESLEVEDEMIRIILIIGINSYNSLYVAIKLGQTATQMTSIFILSIDFLLNIQAGFKIINLHRSTRALDIPRITRDLKERDYHLSKLILIELMEVLVPFAYVITVLLAYYGPNAEILGNIRNDYWQYKSIDDIWKVVLVVLAMFIIDGSSAILVGCMLWKVCSIHFLRETCKLIGSSWPIIAVNIANYVNYVSLNVFKHLLRIIIKSYNKCKTLMIIIKFLIHIFSTISIY